MEEDEKKLNTDERSGWYRRKESEDQDHLSEPDLRRQKKKPPDIRKEAEKYDYDEDERLDQFKQDVMETEGFRNLDKTMMAQEQEVLMKSSDQEINHQFTNLGRQSEEPN